MAVISPDANYSTLGDNERIVTYFLMAFATFSALIYLMIIISLLHHFWKMRSLQVITRHRMDSFLLLIFCQCSTDFAFLTVWIIHLVWWSISQSLTYQMCIAMAATSHLTQAAGGFLIVLIAYERMELMIYDRNVDFVSVTRSLSLIFVFVILYAALPFMFVSVGTYSVYGGGIACFATENWNAYFLLTLAIVSVTMILTGCFYLKIYFHLADTSDEFHLAQRGIYIQLVLIFLALLFGWMPFVINGVLVLLTGQSSSSAMRFLASFCIVAHSCFNACLFAFKNAPVHEAVERVFPLAACLSCASHRIHPLPRPHSLSPHYAWTPATHASTSTSTSTSASVGTEGLTPFTLGSASGSAHGSVSGARGGSGVSGVSVSGVSRASSFYRSATNSSARVARWTTLTSTTLTSTLTSSGGGETTMGEVTVCEASENQTVDG